MHAFGSDFTQVLLATADEGAMASAMFLEPGGLIGRHEATTGQLLCVVAGAGFVSGSDGVEVAIEPLQAAFWEAGELHETRTDTGMAVIAIEGVDIRAHAPSN